MPARPRLDRRRLGWLWHLGVVLAAVSQLSGLLLPLLEGREGRGMGTHIEAVGDKVHYVHDESTCGACHVRSMHGRVAPPPRLAISRDVRAVGYGLDASGPPLAERTSSNRTRAPPSVI